MATRHDLLHRIQSPSPTRYRLAGGDAFVHLFCAYDAVLFSVLTDAAVQLDANPPAGPPIRVVVGPDGPDREDLWLSFVERDVQLPHAPGQASNRCPFLHVFADPAEAEAWRDTLPEAIARHVAVIPFAEAWARARRQVAALEDGARRPGS